MELFTGLIERVKQGDLKSIQYIVKKNGTEILHQLDIGGRSLLHWAVDTNHYEIAQYLLLNHINPNITDKTGATCLDYLNLIFHDKSPALQTPELILQNEQNQKCYNAWLTLLSNKNAIEGSQIPFIHEIPNEKDEEKEDFTSDPIQSKFWQSQPVNKEQKSPKEFSVSLPKEIYFAELEQPNGNEEKIKSLIKEVDDLLKQDDENSGNVFSGIEFHPSIELLSGVLRKSTCWTGLREKQSNQLVGFIAGTILSVSLQNNKFECYEVHSLVLHPKYRGFHLTPMLIQQLNKQSKNVTDLVKGIFTTASKLPIQPLCIAKFYYRLIRPKVMQFTPFLHFQNLQSMAEKCYLASISLPDKYEIFEYDSNNDKDEVFELVTNYLSRFPLHQVFNSPTECEARIGGMLPQVRFLFFC